jgi:hypothetical protein
MIVDCSGILLMMIPSTCYEDLAHFLHHLTLIVGGNFSML